MARSNLLYLLIVLVFAIPFIGAMFIKDATIVYALCIAIGIILFIVRIERKEFEQFPYVGALVKKIF